MKILLVTNMYPTEETPYYGIFVSEQVRAVKKECPNVEYDIYNIRGNVSKVEYIRSISGVHRQIARGHYDLVHVHYGFSGLFLLHPFRKLNIPVVVTLHGGDIQEEQGKTWQVRFTKLILRRASYAITLNERMNNIVRQYCAKTTIIPCSVDTDLFMAGEERIPYDQKRPAQIVFPSAHSRVVKNYPLFLSTLACLKEKYGIEAEETELNNMSRQNIAHLFQRADALLMTSISEGSPQVVKEAMACNLPVVTTKVGDVDVLLDGVAGSGWVDPHDANLLADKLYASLQGSIPGISPREKIFQLHLNDSAIALRLREVYADLCKA